MFKFSEKAKHAICIGVLCSVSYLAVYIARNILSTVTPQMLEGGVFTESEVGKISSLYFIFYAIGQLINGAIGDKIKARYMISSGLLIAGISNFVFIHVTSSFVWAVVAYAVTGFSLAMIYGPMTKVIAENTEPIHATRCSLGYTFASFFGSPMAGILASFLVWQSVFMVSSVSLIMMAVISFVVFLTFEKKGIVKYGMYEAPRRGAGGIKLLLERKIVKFALIAIITGIIRTSVVFWMPTYLSQRLEFSASDATKIFTVATFIISLTTFIVVFIYERMGRNMDKTILLMFSLSTAFFTGVYFVKTPVVNIILMVLAIMSSGGAATMLFSRYLPSLRDTGMVSGATGFLDFLSYMGAAFANVVFADAATSIGWGNLILVWIAIVALGVIVALPYGKFRKKNSTEESCEEN